MLTINILEVAYYVLFCRKSVARHGKMPYNKISLSMLFALKIKARRTLTIGRTRNNGRG
jgi:hypothetical protein